MPSASSHAAPVSPQLAVLSNDHGLIQLVAGIAEEFDVQIANEPGEWPTLVDPAIGASALTAHFQGVVEPPLTAVLRRTSNPGAAYLALRLSGGTLVDDPRRRPQDLRAFLENAFAVTRSRVERRGYPRASASGVEILDPPGTELLDLSPYGARIRLAGERAEQPILSLRVRLERPGLEDMLTCHVAESIRAGSRSELRLRFIRVTGETQQELFKIAKAQILASTLRDTVERLERVEVDGFRWLTAHEGVVRILRELATHGVGVTFARVHGGRVVQGTVRDLDESARQLRIALPAPQALGPPGSYLCFAATWKHESFLFDGFVLAVGDGEVVIGQPTRCVLTDQRAQDRLVLGLDSPLRIRVGERWFPVTDLSPRGFAFYVGSAADEDVLPRAGQLDVEFHVEGGLVRQELALLRYRRPEAVGFTAGATFVDTPSDDVSRTVLPLHEEESAFPDAAPRSVATAYRAESVRFACGERQVAGLWNEVRHPGPTTVFVVPPAWGKTKESVSILAQFLCAIYDANARHVAVLRIDYVNALGESTKDAGFDRNGKETLGLELSECVQNLTAAIDYAHGRLGAPATATALIGMSFSGPLCLRAAVEDPRVTHLVELMGASDLQDLIRTASGGIDYVANYRAGVRHQVRNILGVLSDADRWCADGLRARLLLIQDAQRDAARLRIPLLWVHGRYDAFVNELRIRSILASAPTVERRLVVVPCGHVPTKSVEALLAYLPVARFVLAAVGVEHPAVAVPNERVAATVAAEEWARAPRIELASPREYWRSYMLGATTESLGFDVLAMTREYQELMDRQIDLLELADDAVLADLGCGLGHSLEALARRAERPALRVMLYDLVPQLLETARVRAESRLSLETFEWDAELDGPPALIEHADAVLMSLFLSCVVDPATLVRQLAARLKSGARLVASTFRPDADFSQVYVALLRDIRAGTVAPLKGYDEDRTLHAVREYMSSAAFLLRLFDEGRFRFFEVEEFGELFAGAGLTVRSVERTFGTPPRAIVLRADKP
ncbi:MAG: methyltransferase domain-containing protein [bacterium]